MDGPDKESETLYSKGMALDTGKTVKPPKPR